MLTYPFPSYFKVFLLIAIFTLFTMQESITFTRLLVSLVPLAVFFYTDFRVTKYKSRKMNKK